jgi:tetratricopeptide (TPR) repeat protein
MPNTPAERVGIRRGDVIKSINGQAIKTAAQVQQAVEKTKIGEHLPLQLTRQGRTIDLNVEVGVLKPYYYSSASFNRGLAHSKQQKYEAAIEDYTRAIEINKNWGNLSETYFGLPTAYKNRGIAHSKQQNYEAAIKDYNQAIALKPDYADPRRKS